MLAALYGSAKNFHYNAKSNTFYGNHLFGDRLSEDLIGFIDDIQEVCYLGIGEDSLDWATIFEKSHHFTVKKSNNLKDDIAGIKSLIQSALKEIATVAKSATVGEQNLLGGISQSLQQKNGFLNRYLKG